MAFQMSLRDSEVTVLPSMTDIPFFAFYSESPQADKDVSTIDFLKKNCERSREFREKLCLVSEKNGELERLKIFLSDCMEYTFIDEINLVKDNEKQNPEYFSGLDQQETVSGVFDVESKAFDQTKEMKRELIWLQLPFEAIEKNDVEILNLCFHTNMDFDKFRWMNGSSLLMQSLRSSSANMEIIDLLIQKIDLNLVSNNGNTALSDCLQNDSLPLEQKLNYVRTLIARGALTQVSNYSVSPVLHTFVSHLIQTEDEQEINQWKTFADELLKAKIDVDEKDWLGQTALMCAILVIPPFDFEESFTNSEEKERLENVRKKKLSLIEYLLEIGADTNIQDFTGRTCLHLAVTTQSIDVIDIMLKNKCDPNALTNTKMNPAYFLCCDADWSDSDSVQTILIPILENLVTAGCDLNIKSVDQTSVLHFAAAKMDSLVCKMLVDNGANTEARDYLKRTPLHFAARNNSSGVAETLIELGADINAVDIHNDTPLHAACLLSNFGVAKVLIDSGASLSSVGDLGIQPIHLAAENGDGELMAFVGDRVDLKGRDDWNAMPIHYAASDGNIETTKYLVDMKASDDEENLTFTPFELALYRGQYKTAEKLSADDACVKFGHLPPHMFPNRPLVQILEMDTYFQTVSKSLKEMNALGPDLGNLFLDSAGLGRVNFEEGETKIISDIILDFVERIVNRVGEIDPVFRCKLLPAGSTAENVKIAYPDEFDFVCNIEGFSRYVSKITFDKVPGFAKIIMKEDSPEEVLKFCVRSSHCLSAMSILRYFARLVRLASFDVLNEGISNIYAGHMLLRETEVLFQDNPIPLGKLNKQTVTFRGQKHKFLDISLDLNPVVHISEVPHNFVTNIHTVPNMAQMGMYLIPKFCQQAIVLPAETLPLQSDLWRFSTHHFETAFMQNIPQLGRDCYMLCKIFRIEPLTCSVDIKQAYSYFHKMIIESKDQAEEGDVDSDDNSESEVDQQIDDSASEEGINEWECASNDVDSECLYIGDDEDEDEITAETAIPTYFLKAIFMKEAEEMARRGEKFTKSSLSTIPRKVYEKLHHAIETKDLSTLFLPSHNIYHKAMWSSEDATTMKLRDIYCKNIIGLMEELDFKCQV